MDPYDVFIKPSKSCPKKYKNRRAAKRCRECEFLKFNNMTNIPICMKDAYSTRKEESTRNLSIDIPDGCVLVEENGVLVPVKIQ